MIFYWFLYYFVEIDVFDVKTVPRRFGDEMWPKMAPNWSPKTTPNRSKIKVKKTTKNDGKKTSQGPATLKKVGGVGGRGVPQKRG